MSSVPILAMLAPRRRPDERHCAGLLCLLWAQSWRSFRRVMSPRSWTNFDVMQPLPVFLPPDSPPPKFAQSLAFKAWQLLLILFFSLFSFTHVHSSWHCCC